MKLQPALPGEELLLSPGIQSRSLCDSKVSLSSTPTEMSSNLSLGLRPHVLPLSSWLWPLSFWPWLLWLHLNLCGSFKREAALRTFAHAVAMSGGLTLQRAACLILHQLPPQRGLPWLSYVQAHPQSLSILIPCSPVLALPSTPHSVGA